MSSEFTIICIMLFTVIKYRNYYAYYIDIGIFEFIVEIVVLSNIVKIGQLQAIVLDLL